jgi:predicted ATPase
LPIPPTPLVGREAELTALARLLRDPQCRLITLIGAGGMGKTRLAIEAATRQAGGFSDGAYFVSLARSFAGLSGAAIAARG